MIRENGVEIPFARLTPELLRRVAEEFVTRDGTDYGAVERTLEQKVAAVRHQLERGEAVILYDTESETLNIAPRRKPR